MFWKSIEYKDVDKILVNRLEREYQASLRIISDIPSENADMSNDKGFYPRLKLMVFINQRPLSLYTT